MFLETAIAVFLLGSLVAFAFVWFATVRPLERQIRDRDLSDLGELRQRRYRAEARRKHMGTPYISPLPTDVERLLVDIACVDDHNGSRKAPELRVVS